MSTDPLATPADTDSPAMREAGPGLLSLALMDARNQSLGLLAAFEAALGPELTLPGDPAALRWSAGHIAWLAEYWIARNPQRGLGRACPDDGVRLPSALPEADALFDPRVAPPSVRAGLALPGLDALRGWWLETLESTLDLLDKTPDTPEALHFFHMALFHEDWRAEQWITLAQTAGVALPLHLPAGAATREPLAIPAGRWTLGDASGGFALDIARGELSDAVPEFEIDAQPVTWAQYVEFIDDGGYDRAELWHPQGWTWLQARQHEDDGRRGPRHVEQIGVASGAVMQTFLGKPTRMGGTQAAMHVSWWEADAYARWAGRRLPTELEWERAVHLAGRRGLRWGDVWEWTATTLRPWPGYAPEAWSRGEALDPVPALGRAKVLRGGSWATRARMKHPKARAWALPEQDEGFVGFRTCAF